MDSCHHDFERRHAEPSSSRFESHNSMIDMANPTDVRNAFYQSKHHHRHHGRGEDHVEFDNPYGQHHPEKWSCSGSNSISKERISADYMSAMDSETAKNQPETQMSSVTYTKPETQINPAIYTKPEIQTNPETQPSPEPANSPVNLSVESTANIEELTQLSEQLLPVHSNLFYRSSTDWERLHTANVQKSADAAQNGSKMVLLGDSITEATGYNPGALRPFQQAFPADNPVGIGLGGDGTTQLLYRVNHGELQGQPQTAVLMIGKNDIASLSSEQIGENTANIIKSIHARSPNTKIVLMGILPRPESGDSGNVNVDATNSILSRLATTNGSVQFVNLRNSFIDANGNERPELYQADKLHLSDAGYQTWATGLKSALG